MSALALLLQDILPAGDVNAEWAIRALAGALIAVVAYVARREEKRTDALAVDNRKLIETVATMTALIDNGFEGIHRRLDALAGRASGDD